MLLMSDRIKHVYLFHHTHTDIGYTHPQEEVAEQQAANITRALDFCQQTGDRPPASRFAWTVETGWTHVEARGLPVRTAGGHALLDLHIDADAAGAIVRVRGEATLPLPALQVRLGTASDTCWRALPAGALVIDASLGR
jgi:hypothetical protein